MPDAIFADPRLARLYDAFDGPRVDLNLYLGIAAELEAASVLDVGCGTGSLAVMLASSGRTVVGVDPALASLEIARAKESRVTWIHGDATTLPALSVDLATMTGNVAQVFLGDDWEATLRGVRRALKPGGHFVFETRRPEHRAWEDWSRAKPHTYQFPDGSVISSDSTLRFRSRPEIEQSLTRSGFEVVDVRDAPDRPGREHVFVARRVN